MQKYETLIIPGIPIGNYYGRYAIKQMTTFLPDECDFASFSSLAFTKRYMNRFNIVDFNPYLKSYWAEGREYLKQFKYKKIYYMFSTTFLDYAIGHESKITRMYKRSKEFDKRYLGFDSARQILKRLFMLIDLDTEIEHFISDPLEADISKIANAKEYCFYEIPNRAEYHPFIEIAIKQQPGPLDKDINFLFGFSNVSRIPFRTNLYYELLKYNIPFYYKGKDEENINYLSADEYNERLRHAKYTYIIPSYDVGEYSLIRHLEARHRDVKVLVHPECNLQRINTDIHRHLIDEIEIVEPKDLRKYL